MGAIPTTRPPSSSICPAEGSTPMPKCFCPDRVSEEVATGGETEGGVGADLLKCVEVEVEVFVLLCELVLHLGV